MNCRHTIIIGLFAVTCLLLPLFSVQGQTITPSDQEVQYDLPHPGILPDNPFFAIKSIRDSVSLQITQDPLEKAKMILELSDKRIASAKQIAEKGKHKGTMENLRAAEEQFLQIPALLKESREQGVIPSAEFMESVRMSNQKHKEIIEECMKDIPQGEQDSFYEVFKLNEKARKAFE